VPGVSNVIGNVTADDAQASSQPRRVALSNGRLKKAEGSAA